MTAVVVVGSLGNGRLQKNTTASHTGPLVSSENPLLYTASDTFLDRFCIIIIEISSVFDMHGVPNLYLPLRTGGVALRLVHE